MPDRDHGAADSDLSCCNRAKSRGEAERRQQRRDGEHAGGQQPAARRCRDLTKREECPAQDKPDQSQHEERIETEEYRLEEQREAGPADDRRERQPHVVGFPDRRHGMVDERPHLAAVREASGEQVPDARAIVGASRRAVDRDRQQQHARDSIVDQSVHGGGGPYGAATSGAGRSRTGPPASSRRHRFESRSRTVMKK